jgi:hypothetical protein
MDQPLNQPLSYTQAVELAAKEFAAMPIGERVPLALMAAPPTNPLERVVIGDQMWVGVVVRFESGLCERDRVLWQNPPARVTESPEHLRLMHAFDDFLLSMFAEFGWRLLMSVGAIQRISEWEKHNPMLLERLGTELAQRSKVLRGEGRARYPEDMDVFADVAIPELERLFRLKREKFGRHRPSCTEVAEWIKSEVTRRPEEFPSLSRELLMLEGFVRNLPTLNRDLAWAFERGNIGARRFIYEWFALCHGRSRKDLQNQISERRAQRRRAVRA